MALSALSSLSSHVFPKILMALWPESSEGRARVGLFSGFMGTVTGEIEKLGLGFAAGVDVGMGSEIVGNVQVGHAGSLLMQLVADQCKTVAVERRPNLFNVARILVGSWDAAFQS